MLDRAAEAGYGAVETRDGAAWSALGRELGALARGCRDLGVRLLYHNHDFELGRYQGRSPRVHVKDLARSGSPIHEDGWADVGDRVMDWSTLIPACRRAGAEWLVVEHDVPRDALASARRSAAYLEALL